MRAVRLYESALADVLYVYRAPVAVPWRRDFETDAEHRTARDRHRDDKQLAVIREAERADNEKERATNSPEAR